MISFSGRKILVVAAHPDDEALGCGGVLARASSEGADVQVLFMADGTGAREPGDSESNETVARRNSAFKASSIMGVSKTMFRDFPDNRLDSVALLDVVKSIESVIDGFSPDTVLTHHAGDLNVDHQVTHKAVLTACRPQPDCTVKNLLFFEVQSSTEWSVPGTSSPFQPNCFLDISDYVDEKLEALKAYEQEMRAWPHTRSMQAVEHLIRWRGASVGVNAAEAFMIGRAVL